MWYEHKARVICNGEFPIDMLRHDTCYPATESCAGDIASSVRVGSPAVTFIKAVSQHRDAADHWTLGRWESFGCTLRDFTTRKLGK